MHALSRSSGKFDDTRWHVHVGDQQHLNGMTHEQQENWQQSGHGTVAAVAVLHGRRVFTCQRSRYFRYHYYYRYLVYMFGSENKFKDIQVYLVRRKISKKILQLIIQYENYKIILVTF